MSEEYPLISIIVPVYKVERYIDKCVKSLINQTYKNLEIILVDDGSPDNCHEICDKWAEKDNRIKVIHKENGGVSSARNIGLAESTGEYIGFVDSDDWIEPDMYEYLYKILSDNNADISCADFCRTDDENYVTDNTEKDNIRIYDNYSYLKNFFRIASKEILYYIWNRLYKKSLIPDNPFPMAYSNGEDVIASYLMIRDADKIVVSDRKMYYYRQNSGVTSCFNPSVFKLRSVWNDMCRIAEPFDPVQYEWTVINRKRINLSILANLAETGEYKNYKAETDELIKGLKNNKKDLMKADIGKSRKIMINLFCSDYYFWARIISKVK